MSDDSESAKGVINIEIAVSSDGQCTWNGEPVTYEEVKSRLKALGPPVNLDVPDAILPTMKSIGQQPHPANDCQPQGSGKADTE